MTILGQCIDLLVMAGDTYEYFDNDFSEVCSFTLHNALFAIVSFSLLYLPILIEIPIFQVLIPCSHKILSILRKCESIDRFT